MFRSSSPKKMSCGVNFDELYVLIISSSACMYGYSPVSGTTSLYDTYASSVGDLNKGCRLLKTRKEVLGCLNAVERNVWSARRNDTRFNGDPAKN